MTDLSGPIRDFDGNESADATVAKACINALIAVYPDEDNLSGEDKVRRAFLAQRIHINPKIDLTAEEVVLVKSLVSKAFSPLVVLRIWEAIDPASVK